MTGAASAPARRTQGDPRAAAGVARVHGRHRRRRDARRLDGPQPTLAAAMLAYVLGSVALGALSMGHEYTGRTLTLLLSLPAHRRRLYLVKLGVLIAMLVTLGALASSLIFVRRRRTREHPPDDDSSSLRDVRPVSGAVVDDDLPQPARGRSCSLSRYRE